MLRTDKLDYRLPPELIATTPAPKRTLAKLMVCNQDRSKPSPPAHRHVSDLPKLLEAGDLLVLNTSKVVQARMLGARSDTGGKVQMLYLRGTGQHWQAFVRAKRVRPGTIIALDSAKGRSDELTVELVEPLDPSLGEPGAWKIRSQLPIESILDRAGRPPLPPYILSARRNRHEPEQRDDDQERYQTVFAEQAGSVAAPTAGLHLSDELLDDLRAAGVQRAEVVLHVGSGTFKPIEAEHVEEHPMHAETCSVSQSTIDAISECRTRGGRVIAVGTTAARALESYAQLPMGECPAQLDTSILIAPGYRWRWVDGLMTNFHLPRSTLLAMVASLFTDTDADDAGDDSQGVHTLLKLYAEAIECRYRFYSYGDAMLVLPQRTSKGIE